MTWEEGDFKLDHIGWISRDPALFEAFWCDVLEFRKVAESELGPERALALFSHTSGAKIRRYARLDSDGHQIQVEIHVFDDTVEASQSFARFGINHICLFVADRPKFLEQLPPTVKIHRYTTPGGWENVFIQDLEDNWIELRTSV